MSRIKIIGAGQNDRRLTTRRIALIGLLTAGALICGLAESQFPLPFPGMRLGISNVFYLLALILIGAPEALCVAALRLIILFVLTGNVFALAASAGGLALSLPLTIFLYRVFDRSLSVRAISVASAAAFNLGQLSAVVLLNGTPRLFVYYPILMAVGLATGWAVGAAAEAVSSRLRRLV